MSKTLKSFRLSQEAVEVLERQENATKFLEDLILGKNSPQVPWKELEFRIEQLKEAVEIYYVSQKLNEAETPTENRVIGIPVDIPECCTNTTSRCKHWQFNPLEDVWYNPNTGEERNI